MSECTNKALERLLYAYELGMLADKEAQEVEQHLYECEHCFNQVREFQDAIQLLSHSQSVRSQIHTDAAGPRTIRFSWVVMAAAVIVLAFPVYRLLVDSTSPPVVQSLQLVPFRGNGSTVLDLSQGGTAEIQFVVEGATTTDTTRVAISARKGPEIYSNDAFVGFNELGQGTIVMPVNSFKPGYYVLTVTGSSVRDTVILAEYPFRVK